MYIGVYVCERERECVCMCAPSSLPFNEETHVVKSKHINVLFQAMMSLM